MKLTEAQIAAIVENVVNKLAEEGAFEKAAAGGVTAGDGVFPDVDAALRAAELAQRELDAQTLDKRREIVAVIRRAVEENVQTLARMAVDETKLGRYDDKIKKNLCVAQLTPGPEDLAPIVFTGDHGLALVERAPYGVIGSITPCTNPSETIICNGIGMIAGGNSVVFNPHPSAKEISAYTVRLLNKAVVAVGGAAEPSLQHRRPHPGERPEDDDAPEGEAARRDWGGRRGQGGDEQRQKSDLRRPREPAGGRGRNGGHREGRS